MLHISCKGCHAWTVTEDVRAPNAALTCPCCPLDHDHDAAANACPGSHPPCPDGDTCVYSAAEGGHPPGGHCWTGYGTKPDGCTVCRPIVITGLPGSTRLRMASRTRS